MVDEVSSVSQQTAAEATNVSAASEEQASSLSEASTNIQQLSGLAEELHDTVADFEVDDRHSQASPVADEATVPTTASADGASEPTDHTPDSDLNVIEPGTELNAVGTDGGTDAADTPEADQ